MTEMGMTESEALLRIKDMEYECMNSTIHYYTDKDIPMLRLSEKALEEIQQYRAIGTIEEFKALKEKNETLKALYEDARKEGSHLIARERAKAIDEFAEKLIKHISQMPSGYIGSGNVLIIAEQMKAGGIDG